MAPYELPPVLVSLASMERFLLGLRAARPLSSRADMEDVHAHRDVLGSSVYADGEGRVGLMLPTGHGAITCIGAVEGIGEAACIYLARPVVVAP